MVPGETSVIFDVGDLNAEIVHEFYETLDVLKHEELVNLAEEISAFEFSASLETAETIQLRSIEGTFNWAFHGELSSGTIARLNARTCVLEHV